MAYSKVVITITGDPTAYHAVSINARHKDTPPNEAGNGTLIYYGSWYYYYQYDGSRTQNKIIVSQGNPITTAFNLYTAILEDYPEIKENIVFVSSIYPGNTSEDLEKLITEPLEDKLKSVNNIIDIRHFTIFI